MGPALPPLGPDGSQMCTGFRMGWRPSRRPMLLTLPTPAVSCWPLLPHPEPIGALACGLALCSLISTKPRSLVIQSPSSIQKPRANRVTHVALSDAVRLRIVWAGWPWHGLLISPPFVNLRCPCHSAPTSQVSPAQKQGAGALRRDCGLACPLPSSAWATSASLDSQSMSQPTGRRSPNSHH